MTTHRAAAVLVTAAAALIPLLTACGSSDAGSAKPAADASAAAASAAEASTDGTSSGSDADASPKAVIPDDKITPATGTFTKKQKEYLEGRVPEGNDPAAILQTGQETCDRLERVSKIDRAAAVGAIIAGDIKNADGAVKYLCTDLKSLVADTEGGLADGTHSSPAAGRYRALTPTDACSWQLDGKSGTTTTVTIPSGTKTFASTGCYAWQRL